MIGEGRKSQSAARNDLLAMMLEANRGEVDAAGLVAKRNVRPVGFALERSNP